MLRVLGVLALGVCLAAVLLLGRDLRRVEALGDYRGMFV